jgi:hypothetical protein
MRAKLIALIFFVGIQAAGQNIPATAVFDTQTSIVQSSQPAISFASTKPTKPGIFNRKFLLLAGIATAATMLDVATTSHCMSTYGDCQEGNPLLGSHPSTAKLYGVSFSMLGGQLLASAWVRHKAPDGKLWMMPPIIATAGHGLAAVLNVRTMHQLSSAQ